MESFLIVWVVFFSCEVLGMWNFRVSGQGTDLQCSRLDCWLFFASYKVKYKLPTSNIHFLHWWHRKKVLCNSQLSGKFHWRRNRLN